MLEGGVRSWNSYDRTFLGSGSIEKEERSTFFLGSRVRFGWLGGILSPPFRPSQQIGKFLRSSRQPTVEAGWVGSELKEWKTPKKG